MTSGGQCVMTAGAALMLLWSADSWDMLTLEVSPQYATIMYLTNIFYAHAAGRPFSNAFFGAGTGPIFLDDVQCTSSASQLLECSSRPILSHNCLHSADAGVACEGMFLKAIGYKNEWKQYIPATKKISITLSSLCNWSVTTGRW